MDLTTIIKHFKPSTIKRLGGIDTVNKVVNAIDETSFNPMIVAAHLAGNGTNWCCTKCGNCCREPSHIFLLYGDIANLARHFNISITEAKKRYTVRLSDANGDLQYYIKKSRPCMFYIPTIGCKIYEVRPTVCAVFPLHKTETEITIGGYPYCSYLENAIELTAFLDLFNIAILIEDDPENKRTIKDMLSGWFSHPEGNKCLTQKEAVLKMAMTIRGSGVKLDDLYELTELLS